MATLSPIDVSTRELAELGSITSSLPDGSLKSTLYDIHSDLTRGETVFVLTEDEAITPAFAAQLLGLSRTHLYKILDSGALAFHVVGERDRRILVKDLVAYKVQLRAAQRQTARVLATGSGADDAALDEMS